jgi:hypothetical protein
MSSFLTKERLIIKYQEFCLKPSHIDIWLKSYTEYTSPQNKIYHSISGNPSRFTDKEFRVKQDIEYKNQGIFQNFIYDIFSFPLNLAVNTLGYIQKLRIKK